MIILIGYMGSGKTTIGKLLMQKTGCPFIDLDAFIEQEEQMAISEIFEKKGEIFFRKIENEYLKKLLNGKKEMVLSVGGGTPCFAGNMDILLNATPNVMYLKASVSWLTERLISEKSLRPLIKHIQDEDMEEFIRKHLFERNYYYLKAPFKISIDHKSPEMIANEIIDYSR
ncbi:shikimate kinase [Ascidiimonas aurantiaca]|uniref:shikimate kinase n=1 Tax=Ascidiimonas aurantiaca TaxID=1685432 RepID=UPI0030EC3B35